MLAAADKRFLGEAAAEDKFLILGAAGMVLGLVLQLERILVGSSGSRKV